MKKVIAVILCIILLTGTLSGCFNESVNTYATMMKLLESMESVTEGEILVELSFAGTDSADSESTQAFSGNEISGISLSCLMSLEKQQMQMAINYTGSNGEPIELTDEIIVGNESYVNMSKIYDAILPLAEGNDIDNEDYLNEYFTAIMDGNEYVYKKDSRTWETDNLDLLSGLNYALYSPLAELGVVTFSDDVYTITLEGENYKNVLPGVLTEIRDNADAYTNIITEALGEIDLSTAGASLPEGSDLTDGITGLYNELLSELIDQDVSGKKMIGTLSYDKESKTFTQNIDLVEDDQSFFKITRSVVAAEIGDIIAPEMSLTYEQLEANIEVVDDALEDFSNTEDTLTYEYTAEASNAIQPFINRDLSGYANLQPYDITAKSGTVYSVPLFVTDNIDTYNDTLITQSPGMWQYFMSYANDNGDTAKSFLEWHVQGYYDYNYDNPSNSNMLVSFDRNLAVMSFSHEDPEDGKITNIYVALVVDNGDILLMNFDIYHNFMEDFDYTALSELSDLIGVDLSTFYNLDFNVM